MTDVFKILVVCRGNHCRSPLMEFLLRRQAALRGLNWTVDSAGVAAEPGRPMHRHAARVLRQRGFDPSRWHSQPVGSSTYARADLILTATRRERSFVAGQYPGSAERTYTLLQFAEGIARRPAEVPIAAAELGPWLTKRMAWGRERIQPTPIEHRDLLDPMPHGLRSFRICAQTVDHAYDLMLGSGPPPNTGLSPTLK